MYWWLKTSHDWNKQEQKGTPSLEYREFSNCSFTPHIADRENEKTRFFMYQHFKCFLKAWSKIILTKFVLIDWHPYKYLSVSCFVVSIRNSREKMQLEPKTSQAHSILFISMHVTIYNEIWVSLLHGQTNLHTHILKNNKITNYILAKCDIFIYLFLWWQSSPFSLSQICTNVSCKLWWNVEQCCPLLNHKSYHSWHCLCVKMNSFRTELK